MNNPQKIVVATLSVGAVIGVGLNTRRSLHEDLYERFPTIDKKTVRTAYRKMMWKALTNQIDIQTLADDQMDDIFLEEVRNLKN